MLVKSLFCSGFLSFFREQREERFHVELSLLSLCRHLVTFKMPQSIVVGR